MGRHKSFVWAALITPAWLLLPGGGVLAQEPGEEPVPAVAKSGEGEGLTDEFALLEDQAVVESAARHKQEIGMSPSAVTVFTREDIETSGATAIADLLRRVPGMDAIKVSFLNTALGSRTFWTDENNLFLVLIDGREANLELLGESLLEIEPIALEDIERIEVLRGPASSIYGANAFCGVISITTRAIPEKSSYWGTVRAGEIGNGAVGVRGATVLGGFGLSLGGAFDTAGSFSDPGEITKRVWKLRAVAENRFGDHHLRLDAGFSAAEGSLSSSAAGPLSGSMGVRTLRLEYDWKDLRAQLYWTWMPTRVTIDTPLVFNSTILARFRPVQLDAHTLDGQLQWKVPELWSSLLLILGGSGRATWLNSDQLLDESYADPTSTNYHEPGVRQVEGRAGVFVHAELKAWDWLTVTGGLRLDYNSETQDSDLWNGTVVSPRLAAVFRPADGQFLRVGVARAFRKPAFVENGLHPMVDVPAGSPFYGQEVSVQEFMTRILGNTNLRSEELISAEAGYLGSFFDGRLSVALDLFFNQYANLIEDVSRIVYRNGLPVLSESSDLSENTGKDPRIFGSELSVRCNLSAHLALEATWAHREVFYRGADGYKTTNDSPKNLLSLGGRFRTEIGLLGSLYLFSRSEFWDRSLKDPNNILGPYAPVHMDNTMLFIGKLGWRWLSGAGIELETGVNLFLPFSPFSGPTFRSYEEAGAVNNTGQAFGAAELRRMVIGYLQGSF